MGVWEDLEAQTTYSMVNPSVVVGEGLGLKDMVSIQPIRKIVLGQIRAMLTVSLVLRTIASKLRTLK